MHNAYGRRGLVGDGGFEPPTSTMSTWRSTPELIAPIKPTPRRRAAYDTQAVPGAQDPLARLAIGETKAFQADPADLISKPCRLLKFKIPGMPEHLFLELRSPLHQLFR